MQRGGLFFGLLSALGFSSLGLFAKLIYAEGFSVPQSLAWRFSVAALLLWLFVFPSGRHRYPGRVWRSVAMLAVLGFSPQAGLYFLTVRFLDPGMASLLLYLYPAFVILIVFLLFGQKPRPRQLVALGLAMVGCVFTLWQSSRYPLAGIVFGLLLAITYAAYLSVAEKVLKGIDPVFSTALIMTGAAASYWLITLLHGSQQLPGSLTAFFGIAGIAVVATMLPIIALFAAIERIGTANAALVSSVEPLFTIGLSAALLGERLGGLQWLGAACIILSLVVLNAARRPRQGRPGPGLGP